MNDDEFEENECVEEEIRHRTPQVREYREGYSVALGLSCAPHMSIRRPVVIVHTDGFSQSAVDLIDLIAAIRTVAPELLDEDRGSHIGHPLEDPQ